MDAVAQPFVIARRFPAARDLLWKLWTDQAHMAWWGPKGITLVHAKMDLRPGGVFHYGMKTPDGHEMWGKWVIREVAPPERLVFVNSFSDAAGGLTRHPMNAAWPLELLSTITFTEEAGQTLVTITWTPWGSTENEIRTFNENHASMQGGWTGTLDRLQEYLKTL
ncbi:MAG TPA: SRPBCC domain-containing protein [Verrucomicrobiae bacterium]|jgi:uncharacterized protein YndB with AHSA1/START domain|nr:SRPBCC domain-containing protein [Verrucomicrobiae bacterium]